MKTLRYYVAFVTVLPLGLACSSPSEQNTNTGGSGGTPAATAGMGGASAGANTGGNPQGGQSTGGAGATAGGGTGGMTGSAGAGAGSGGSPTGGMAGGGMASGGTGTNTGGSGGTTGGSGGGGSPSGGDSGAAGTGTGGGNSGLKGGASGAFICPPGATYGNPLEGMSEVTSIRAPTSGPVTYFAFVEGPLWIGSVGKLFFSDNASSPAERIWMVTPPSTTPEIFLDNSGSNGLAVDNDDKIIAADQRNKRLTRIDPTAATPMPMQVVSTGNAKPNDLIVRSDGNIYFTDPQEARAFFRVSPAGMVSEPIKAVGAPNGIALSPDETKLYVGDVEQHTITVFTLADDGSVDESSAKLFATTMGNTLDGFAVDCAGNVYGAASNGVEVFSPDGQALGVVPTGESYNPTFGGPDRKTLYVASRAEIKVVKLAVPGLPN